jgi:hypothetical protein
MDLVKLSFKKPDNEILILVYNVPEEWTDKEILSFFENLKQIKRFKAKYKLIKICVYKRDGEKIIFKQQGE